MTTQASVSAGNSSAGTTSAASPASGGVIKRLISTMWHTPWTFTLALVSTVAITIFEVAIPMLTASAVDTATGALDGEIATVIYVLIAVALARYVFQFCRRYSAGRLANLLSATLRVRILNSLQALDGKAQDTLRTGQIVSRSISDLNMTQTMVAMMPLILGNVLKFFVLLGVIVWLDPLLSLVAVSVIPVLIWLTVHSRRVLFAATWSAQQAVAELATHVEETVTGVRVVKAFAQEDNETAKLNKLSRVVYAEMMRQAKLQAKYQPLAQLIPGLALIVGIGLGGFLAIGGHITIGIFFAFTSYISTVTMVTAMIAGMVVQIQLGLASTECVFEVIDLTPHRADPTGDRALAVPHGALGMSLSGVDFAVDSAASSSGKHQVLAGMSLTVTAGETIALVGPPGSGKSMAVQLMTGFYDPDAGSISLDGEDESVDITSLTRADLRGVVSAVFDEPFLYSASIRDNITMGVEATDADVEAAARAAQAHEFITELPGRYDEVVGERGLTLSGGQRQRIALARALFARPKVLILDDATSAVDATTERAIYHYLATELASTTIIAIAHRESTLQLADRIALVDHGRVVDQGTLTHMYANPEFVRLMDARAAGAQELEPEVVLDSPELQEPSWDQLWPRTAAGSPRPSFTKAMQRAASQPGAGAGGGRRAGGGGRRGGMSGSAAATPASAELLARVAALPPATSTPPTSADEFRQELDRVTARSLFGHVVWLIVAVIGLYVVSVLTSLAMPTLVRTAIDEGVTPGNSSVLWWVVGIGVLITLVGWLATVASTIVTMLTGERLLYELRIRSYAHLQRLSMSFYERTMSGTIMTRMTTDIDALSNFLRTGMADTVAAAATLISIVALLAYTSPRLAMIALIAVPIVAVATFFFRRISSRLYTQAREEVSAVNAMFHESIAGLRTSQLHGNEARRLNSFADQTEKFTRTRIRAQRAVSIYFPGINALSELTSAAVLGAGAAMVARGEIAAGVLVAFLLYLGRLFGPIQQLSQVFDSYQQAQVGFRRITDLLRTKPDVTDCYSETSASSAQLSDTANGAPHAAVRPLGPRTQADQVAASAATKDLHFLDVSFAYGNAAPVLSNLNLTIASGTTVAIVGTTGAGKSTIIKLLERFYDPTSGQVLAGTVDIATMPLDSWRRHIGFVPQEPHLFAGTIASNIAYGAGGTVNEEAIVAASRRVGALRAIAAIPGGFNAEVGERGRGLSSGQRQLIALARAELMQPSIMLLDEATATLDPATEKAILAASENVMHGRTSIVVAHRLATAARADRILVIDKGQIIEDGTHEQLLTFGGNYAAMWGSKDA